MTLTFRSSKEPDGTFGVGNVRSDRAAMTIARNDATVVKNPKTFWMRVIALCIFGGGEGGGAFKDWCVPGRCERKVLN